MAKKLWWKDWTLWIIVLVVIVGVLIINKGTPEPQTDENVARCIGSKSVIYSQLSCSACKTQKGLFGDNYQYITEVDCFFENEKCQQAEVSGTPTWVIKGEKYLGVQSIDRLKELTGC